MSSLGSFNSVLSLNGLRLQVKLGCGADERQNPQFVRFDVQFKFLTLPTACQSDHLSDTVCYAEVSQKLESICHREYRLIEHLAWEGFTLLKETLPPNVRLVLRLTKEKPPIPHLQEGATFTVADRDLE